MNENYWDMFQRLKESDVAIDETEEQRRDRVRLNILSPLCGEIERKRRGAMPVAFLTESTDCGKAKLRAAAVKYIAQGFAERSEEEGPGAVRAGKEKKKNS